MRSAIVITLLLLISPQAIGRDNIVQTAAEAGNFRTLVNLLVATGLDEALEQDGHFTVFAPSDKAFAKLPQETLESLLQDENREQLAEILKYHVIPQALVVPKRAPSHPITEAETLQGTEIQFRRDGSEVRVNEANIVARNIQCSNGYIHVIDAVLSPPDDESGNSIVDVAAQAGTFETLLAALNAVDLVDALQGEDDLTVFAPTDEAFAKLPKKTLRSLLEPENRSQLQAILKYHVLPGRVSAAKFVEAGTATTLAGPTVSASIQDGRLRVNESNIEVNDIEAGNGVIHVIDQVLFPPDRDASTNSDSRVEKLVEIKATWEDNVVRDGVVADVLNVTSSGGGRVRLTNVKARQINTLVKGGASVAIQGKSDTHECTVYGGGRLSAADLETHSTTIRVNGGGSAQIAADDLLNITAAAGATVRYVTDDGKVVTKANQYAIVERLADRH